VPVRFRKGFDIVHLNWHYGYDLSDQDNPSEYPWKTFQWLVNQAAAASVSADLLLPFDAERIDPYNSPAFTEEDILGYFNPRGRYYAVLAVVEIHISAEEAAQAGVFGALGEEPIQLVDPRDTAAVAKFRNVWARHQPKSPSDKELDVAEFFSTVVDAADVYCARVEHWRQTLEKVWLWYKCLEVRIPRATYDEIWPNWAAAVDVENGDQGVIPFGWRVNWNLRKLNREHPWVQTQLALMPCFEPALMFRHCVGWCGPVGYVNRTNKLSFQRRVEDARGTCTGCIQGYRHPASCSVSKS
jgi:hypothetical protein